MKTIIEPLTKDMQEYSGRTRRGLTDDLLVTVPSKLHSAYRSLLALVSSSIQQNKGRDTEMIEFCRRHPDLGPEIGDCFIDSDLSHTFSCFRNVVRLDQHLHAERRLIVQTGISVHDCKWPKVGSDFRKAEPRREHQRLAAEAFPAMADTVERELGTEIWSLNARADVQTLVGMHDAPSLHEPFPKNHKLIDVLLVHRMADRLDMLTLGKEVLREFQASLGKPDARRVPLSDLPRIQAAHVVKRFVEEAREGDWDGHKFMGFPTIFVTEVGFTLFLERLQSVQELYDIPTNDLKEEFARQMDKA